MADLGQPISQLVGNKLETLRQRIIQNIQSAGAVATGKTIQSIYVERRADGGALKFHGSMPFGVLETGRKGGKVPMMFSTIIYNWMQTKGIHGLPMPYKTNRQHKYASAQERGDWSMASAIARTIARSGTKLYRDGGRTNIYSNEIPQTVQTIREALLQLMKAQVKSIKLNGYNTGGQFQ